MYCVFNICFNSVALRVRAWIEINGIFINCIVDVVALRVRAWIEIVNSRVRPVRFSRRSPCESVD